jgi:YD repeat-containing protein
MGQLRTVTMPRGGTTQVRTFVYNGSLLMSATNPENGTVTYEYNADLQVTARNDAARVKHFETPGMGVY